MQFVSLCPHDERCNQIFVLRKRASNPPCRVRMTIDDRRMADHKYPYTQSAEPDDPANDG